MKKTYLKDYTRPGYEITHSHLFVDLNEESTRVLTQSKVKATSPSSNQLMLNGRQMELVSVQVNGRDYTYTKNDDSISLDNLPVEFDLEIITELKPQDNKSFEGLYKSNGMYCTQCEAESFRKITYFIDRPDNMTFFKTTITADKTKYPVLLSNGNLMDAQDLEGGRHRVTWEDPFKKPSYLFALVAGDLDCAEDSFTTRSGKVVPLKIYVNKGNLDRTAFALKCLKSSMKWDEDVYDLEYDLDLFMIVAVDDFNMGAMENKGLNIFNSQFVLANDKIATDIIYDKIDAIIAHEYFHNWTGNRITCRDWFQLSLKEGLTVFRDQEYSADMTSRIVKRIEDVQHLKAHQFSEDSGPNAHAVRPESAISVDNFYTMTIYEKGAEIIRMYETLLGKEGFKKGMDLYFKLFDGQAVTIDDFAHAMSEANDFDFNQFKLWYSQAGTPAVKVSSIYNEENKTYTLNFEQSCADTPGQSNKQAFHIPVKIGLLNENGNDLELNLNGKPLGHETVLELKNSTDSFTFRNIQSKPIPSLLRDFSAPVKLNYEYSLEEKHTITQCDPNYFQRWEMAQELCLELLVAMAKNPEEHDELLEKNHWLFESFRSNLTHSHDPAFTAKFLELPSLFYVEQYLSPIEPIDLHKSYSYFEEYFAKKLENELKDLYVQYYTTKYEHNLKAIGERSLKNRCLYFLTKTGEQKYIEMAEKQFNTCANMTDQVAALSALNGQDSPEKENCYNSFYNAWCKDPVVFNSFLRIKSADKVESIFNWIKETKNNDKNYHADNPNHISALFGAFSKINSQYHVNYKESYNFLAEEIIHLDKTNPSIASHLAKYFDLWKQYAQPYKSEMETALKKVKSQKDLSKNTYEIVSRALGDT
ncbi:MAG: aminopeptidase N [Bdellovibrionaceae bacterium]|nr:aminopeptidase N [Pseudobdellovibrionaceae bacterium]